MLILLLFSRVIQPYLVNFKPLKFLSPTPNSCYLSQNHFRNIKIFKKYWYLDIAICVWSFSTQGTCENNLMGKFHFIQLFYGKTMNAFKESELCMKNVLFWGTFCSCSSKNEGRGGDQLLQFLLKRHTHYSFIFMLH